MKTAVMAGIVACGALGTAQAADWNGNVFSDLTDALGQIKPFASAPASSPVTPSIVAEPLGSNIIERDMDRTDLYYVGRTDIHGDDGGKVQATMEACTGYGHAHTDEGQPRTCQLLVFNFPQLTYKSGRVYKGGEVIGTLSKGLLGTRIKWNGYRARFEHQRNPPRVDYGFRDGELNVFTVKLQSLK